MRNFKILEVDIVVIKVKAKSLLTAFYPDDSDCLVLDINDVVVFAGQNRLAELGASSMQELIGRKMHDILLMKDNTIERLSYFKDMAHLKHRVCQDPANPILVVVSAQFENERALHFTEIRAICDLRKSVIGCIIRAQKFSLSGHITLNKQIKLTVRQEEIMFLLTIGFSQKEVADIYGVQRGTIVKSIGVICEKFEIQGASTDKLIELVYEFGYGVPPYHLLKAGIFEIPAPFITTAFFRSLLVKTQK